jgi:hypothetical protein
MAHLPFPDEREYCRRCTPGRSSVISHVQSGRGAPDVPAEKPPIPTQESTLLPFNDPPQNPPVEGSPKARGNRNVYSRRENGRQGATRASFSPRIKQTSSRAGGSLNGTTPHWCSRHRFLSEVGTAKWALPRPSGEGMNRCSLFSKNGREMQGSSRRDVRGKGPSATTSVPPEVM